MRTRRSKPRRIVEDIFYNNENIFLEFLFLPLLFLSYFYLLLLKIRNFLYRYGIFKTQKVDSFTISVGNLTVGGTAKTPLVITLGEFLSDRGFSYGVVTRGYRRKFHGDLDLYNDNELKYNPDLYGDEPLVISRNLKGTPVFVGGNKTVLTLKLYKKFKPDVVILDDAFSHLGIVRELNILMIDGRRLFGNGHLLPRGPLREPLSSIQRADIIFIKKSRDTKQEEKIIDYRIFDDKPVFTLVLRAEEPRGVMDDRLINISGNERCFAFCGISDPISFFETLSDKGIEPIDFVEFEDHAVYNERIIMSLDKMAIEKNARYLFCTEKDAVKIKGLIHRVRTRAEFCYLPVKAVVERAFFDFLEGSLKKIKNPEIKEQT